MQHMLKAILALTCVAVAAAQESVVISALIHIPGNSVIELTACTTIADLSQYNIFQYVGSGRQPISSALANLKNIPTGTRVVLSSMAANDFLAFFGFTPKFYAAISQLTVIGNQNYQLVYRRTSIVDSYGTVGVDDTNTYADFTWGWAARHSGAAASSSFNGGDWDVHKGAFGNGVGNNAGAKPPITLGTYQCYKYVEPETLAPTGPPTLRPTVSGRLPNVTRDEPPDHRRPTTTNPPSERIVIVQPTLPPVRNPPRKCPSGAKVTYVTRNSKCQPPTCKNGKGVDIGTPFLILGCGCGCKLF